MTFLEFLHKIYLGLMTLLNGIADFVAYLYHALPLDWPVWLKSGIMLFFVIFSVIAFMALLDGGFRHPWNFIRKIWLLFKSPFGDAEFARRSDIKDFGLHEVGNLFLGRWGGFWRPIDLFHHGEGHFITIAAPGGGKTTAALVPTMLESKHGSLIITDPKGEITAMTRRHRATVSRVIYLNPYFKDFCEHTGLEYKDTGFNPFDMIASDENTRANADKFARLLCVTDRAESNSYFQDEGAELLSLFITWMVKYEPPEHRNLTYLYKILRSSPEEIFKYIDYSNDPVLIDDANRFRDLFDNAPQQWAGAISKAHLATKRYVPTSPLANHVCKSGLDPALLKKEDLTIYILLPSEHIQTGAPWLNMVIGLLGHAVGKSGKARPVTFLLDELPALGFLPDLRSQMREYRSSGLRMWLFSQTAAALTDPDLYGEAGFKDMMGICATKQFFDIEELDLAEQISRLCGERTRLNRQLQDQSDGLGFSTVGVPLIRAEEVLRMRTGEQLIIRKGTPIKAKLVPYFKRRKWQKLTDKNPYR